MLSWILTAEYISSQICQLLRTGFHTSSSSKEQQKYTLEQEYLNLAREIHPQAEDIRPVQYQGGCSYTLVVRPRGHKAQALSGHDFQLRSVIIQFRPLGYDLDTNLARSAREVYGEFAPATVSRGEAEMGGAVRRIYEMDVVPGVRLRELLPRAYKLDEGVVHKLERVLDGLAQFFALGWKHAWSSGKESGTVRQCTGRVGSTVVSRLQKLSRELPTHYLRDRARQTLEAVQAGSLRSLPVVLSHGDFLPSNIMADPETWELRGLVDWAEAEDLPFGMALYCVDHLLGFSDSEIASGGKWMWYEQAEDLREIFWKGLIRSVPELKRPGMLHSIRLSRDVGVFLWHGFAWDNGRIDRVVDEANDAAELVALRALLSVK